MLNAEHSLNYSGSLVLRNTTVTSFHTGVQMGLDATLLAVDTSFIYLTGGSAVVSKNPKTLEIRKGCIYKCESNGVTVKLDNCSDQVLRSISLVENRIVQISGSAMQFEGSCEVGYLPYELNIVDNRINNTGTESRLYMIGGGQTDEEKEDEMRRQKAAYIKFKN